MTVYERIHEQRLLSAQKRARGELEWVADDEGCPDVMRLAALVEEVGEVARAVHDGSEVRVELLQLAGIAAGWWQAIENSETGGQPPQLESLFDTTA